MSLHSDLSPLETHRYSRQLLLPELGRVGQLALRRAKILIVGAGGLGCPAALYLAAAGVGKLGIIDQDVVDLSNIHRQILHATSDVGSKKTASAAAKLGAVNPHVTVEALPFRLTSANALDIVAGYDMVIDGSDNFPTRYLVNDACVLTGKPFVYGSVFRFEGQVATFNLRGGACYRCLFETPPPPHLVPTCAEGGVVGVLPGIIGSLQALEAIKVFTDVGEPLRNQLLVFDGLSSDFSLLDIAKNPHCPACGAEPAITQLQDVVEYCETPHAAPAASITASALDALIRDGNESVHLLDVRLERERELATLGGVSIPIAELTHRLAELDPWRDSPVIVYCKKGDRSQYAVAVLEAAGFAYARSLEGGLDAWRDQIDASLPQY